MAVCDQSDHETVAAHSGLEAIASEASHVGQSPTLAKAIANQLEMDSCDAAMTERAFRFG